MCCIVLECNIGLKWFSLFFYNSRLWENHGKIPGDYSIFNKWNQLNSSHYQSIFGQINEHTVSISFVYIFEYKNAFLIHFFVYILHSSRLKNGDSEKTERIPFQCTCEYQNIDCFDTSAEKKKIFSKEK